MLTTRLLRVLLPAVLLPSWLTRAQTNEGAPHPRNSLHEWRVYHGDNAATHYSALDQINRENVTRLKPAWIHRTEGRRSTIQCNPIMVDGLLYLTSPSLELLALDAASGEKRWGFDPWQGKGGGGVNRGVTYWESGEDRRIFFSAGSYLHAIEARTGKPCRDFGQGGRIDLRRDLDQEVAFESVSATTPGAIFGDLLIMGSRVGEGPQSAAPGHVRAFDVRTGKRRWIFHTIPHPGEFGHDTWPPQAWQTVGGANNWGGLTIDVQRGMVFFGTGSPSYDHYGGNRKGDNLFANCVVALRADSGERVWHYQVVHHDLWDYDIPCQPNLVTVTHRGKQVDAVAQATKMGHLFLLDRESGKPLFPVEEKPVPQSTVPGEFSAPTQPYPLKPPAYAQQRFTKDEVTRLNAEATAAVLKRLESMTTGDLFLPPGFKDSVTLPQFNGGSEWGGAAVDPLTAILYANCSNEAEWISMVPAKPKKEISRWEMGRHLFRATCATCHSRSKQKAIPNLPELPPLSSVAERLTRDQVDDLLKTGRGLMPSFAGLPEADRQTIVGFLFGEGKKERMPLDETTASWASQIPYVATGHNEFTDPEGYPANQRPWGTLNAIDLNEGTIKWQVPLGTYPELEKQGLPPTGTFNIGGPLLTASGLVFIGATRDERFRAFDAESGKVLWEFQLDAGGYASP
ncbi:MAG: PQQ-binding-like beta-propeller repeat protein, partial [Verrucomicrobiota bacterium]